MLLCGFSACAFAQRTAGAAGTRPSLRPLGQEGGATKQSSGEISREEAKVCLQLKNASWKSSAAASLSVIASPAKQSSLPAAEGFWIASLRS